MLPPVNPPRHLSEAISTKLGPYTSLHSRSVQARAMLTSTRQIPAAIANFAPDSDGYLWIKSTTASTKTWRRWKCSLSKTRKVADARRDPLLQAEDLRQTLSMLQTKGASAIAVR